MNKKKKSDTYYLVYQIIERAKTRKDIKEAIKILMGVL